MIAALATIAGWTVWLIGEALACVLDYPVSFAAWLSWKGERMRGWARERRLMIH